MAEKMLPPAGVCPNMVGDCAEATPVLVPLLSLGRRVVATPVAGEPAGTVMIAPANVAAGGRALLDMLHANTAVRKIDLEYCNGMSKAVRKEVERLAEDPARVHYPPQFYATLWRRLWGDEF